MPRKFNKQNKQALRSRRTSGRAKAYQSNKRGTISQAFNRAHKGVTGVPFAQKAKWYKTQQVLKKNKLIASKHGGKREGAGRDRKEGGRTEKAEAKELNKQLLDEKMSSRKRTMKSKEYKARQKAKQKKMVSNKNTASDDGTTLGYDKGKTKYDAEIKAEYKKIKAKQKTFANSNKNLGAGKGKTNANKRTVQSSISKEQNKKILQNLAIERVNKKYGYKAHGTYLSGAQRTAKSRLSLKQRYPNKTVAESTAIRNRANKIAKIRSNKQRVAQQEYDIHTLTKVKPLTKHNYKTKNFDKVTRSEAVSIAAKNPKKLTYANVNGERTYYKVSKKTKIEKYVAKGGILKDGAIPAAYKPSVKATKAFSATRRRMEIKYGTGATYVKGGKLMIHKSALDRNKNKS